MADGGGRGEKQGVKVRERTVGNNIMVSGVWQSMTN